MLQKEKQGDQVKEKVKSTWEEGDLLKLLLAGVDNALDLLCGGVPCGCRSFFGGSHRFGKNRDSFFKIKITVGSQ